MVPFKTLSGRISPFCCRLYTFLQVLKHFGRVSHCGLVKVAAAARALASVVLAHVFFLERLDVLDTGFRGKQFLRRPEHPGIHPHVDTVGHLHDFFGGEGERNGLVLGFIVRSYPVKPILLEWRGAWIIHNTVMFESHLELGGMVWGPVEIFAAWDFRGYYKRSGKSISESKNGFDVGLRYHF